MRRLMLSLDYEAIKSMDSGIIILKNCYFSKEDLEKIEAFIRDSHEHDLPAIILSIADEYADCRGFLYTENEKAYILRLFGIQPDYFVSLSPNAVADLSAQEIVDQFFPNAQSCEIIEETPDSEKSYISQLIKDGHVKEFKDDMGYPYAIIGPVIHGKALGRTVGMPTANLGFSHKRLMPKEGVYGSIVKVDGELYIGLTNIGRRPSVDDYDYYTVETFILDFDKDIYDKDIVLELHEFIRDVQTFDNLEAVKKQVDLDIQNILSKLQHLIQEEKRTES